MRSFMAACVAAVAIAAIAATILNSYQEPVAAAFPCRIARRSNDDDRLASVLADINGAFVATRDPARAKAFYGDTLGLRLASEELPFALVFDAHGTMLRVTVVQELAPAKYTVLGWQVPDIVAAANALRDAGVKLERYGFMDQDELGIP